MKKEHELQIDSNGYVPSIVQWNTGEQCAVCRRADIDLVRHEIFHGTGRRELSKRYGLWITCCTSCHRMLHANPISKSNECFRKHAQHQAMRKYGWSTEDFIGIFGKNYLEVNENA